MGYHEDRVEGLQPVLLIEYILVGGCDIRSRDGSAFPGIRRTKAFIRADAGSGMVMMILGRAQARQRVAGVVRIRMPSSYR